MNIYDRIINILLEARIEDYLERLDEANLLDKGKNWIDKGKARNERAVAQGISRSERHIGHKSNRGVRLQGRKGYGNPTNIPGKEDFVSDTVSGRIASMQKEKRTRQSRADEAIARIEDYLDRLDEKTLKGKQKKLDVNKNKKLDSEDFKMLRSGKRADEGMVKARNKAISRRELRSGFHQAMSDFSEPSVVARALRKAGEARRAGDKAEARRQIGRSKKLDKPQLP